MKARSIAHNHQHLDIVKATLQQLTLSRQGRRFAIAFILDECAIAYHQYKTLSRQGRRFAIALINPMTTTKPKLTFEQYLIYDDGTAHCYELVQGQLKLMNPPTLLHIRIAKFLERQFDSEIERLGYPWEAFREVGQKTQDDTSRLPDVCVVPLEVAEALLNQSAVLQVPSLLVVEIVSPSSSADDYKEKLEEYQALGIPEYWIVNPESKRDKRVTIYQLHNNVYQKQDFRGSQQIICGTFPELHLTADQVLKGKI